MRHAGNFSPEWGYLAPAPSFLHTARVAVVAVAIGATAGAAVVFSLLDRPDADESVAARTLVSVNVASAAETPPAKMAALTTVAEPPRPTLQPVAAKAASVQPTVSPPVSAPKGSTANDSGTTSTTQHSLSVAVLAESPRLTEVPPTQPGIQAPFAADSAALQNSAAQKKSAAKPGTALRFPRGPLALLRPFGYRGEN
jgi:hypothetical protein